LGALSTLSAEKGAFPGAFCDETSTTLAAQSTVWARAAELIKPSPATKASLEKGTEYNFISLKK
jgi:hypothetical protein